MSWTLTKSTNAVALPDPVKGYEPAEGKSQVLARTAAGAVRVYDRAVSVYRLRVTWQGLSDNEKADLLTFFHNSPADGTPGVNGMANAFTLTDDDGNTYTARFVEPELRFTKDVNNRWDVTVRVETDALVTA